MGDCRIKLTLVGHWSEVGNIQMRPRNPPIWKYVALTSSSSENPGYISFIAAVGSIFGRPREMGGLVGSLGVRAEPSLYPEAKYILYQVLIRNASSQPMMNARIVPGIVKGNIVAKDAPKIIPKLGANSSGTATFILEPTGEVGLVEVEGYMTFHRERFNSPLQVLLPPVSFDFGLPQLAHVKLSQEQWKEKVSRYFSDEESFMSRRTAEETLTVASEILIGLGLAYVTRFKAEEGFAAERRDFFAVDKRGRGYAARILWRYPFAKDQKPTLLVRMFAETEDGLFAFCHRVLKRLSKELIPTVAESLREMPGSDQPQF